MRRLADIIERLIVYPQRMAANLDRLGGLIHSQRVLIALAEAGLSREDAYRIVQRNAMKTWSENKDFLTELQNDLEVSAVLDGATLQGLFDLNYHLKHVETIFARVFADKTA